MRGSSPRGRGKLDRVRQILADDGLIPARAGKTRTYRSSDPPTAAHPRAGGENALETIVAPAGMGSSPRGRGKPDVQAWAGCVERLIPARAGKTMGLIIDPALREAHPRAGGENVFQVRDGHAYRGSSPRGRGKRSSRRTSCPALRLIPARAGKTRSLRSGLCAWWAHPRAGGENDLIRVAGYLSVGSSPRGRGKQRRAGVGVIGLRLIPARAGKTLAAAVAAARKRAHPRAGGENLVLAVVELLAGGSSPRGRGKRTRSRKTLGRQRLIPARAGKTRSTPTDPWSCQAHPRAGGENDATDKFKNTLSGPSPRVRGKLQGHGPHEVLRRLIPARAGKTVACGTAPRCSPAHPRAGGENLSAWLQMVSGLGSSPRGRGKPPKDLQPLAGVRLIPARAGKTSMSMGVTFRSRAHPRAGGENFEMTRASLAPPGSSPRGRGKHQPRRDRHTRNGLIPARAGKTLFHNLRLLTLSAHPRAGGENRRSLVGRPGFPGSSPRGRGKHGPGE